MHWPDSTARQEKMMSLKTSITGFLIVLLGLVVFSANSSSAASGPRQGSTLAATQTGVTVTINGVVQAINGNTWVVDNTTIIISSSTSITGYPIVGSRVTIVAIQGNDGQ